jgi:hypothetical protein
LLRETIRQYYRNKNVRARIIEFLGGDRGDRPERFTALYFTPRGLDGNDGFVPTSIEKLEASLGEAVELMRSLWDRRSVIAHLDVDYCNFKYPGESYLHPHRTYKMQRPVAQSIAARLKAFDIDSIHLLSGQGHHFVWQVPMETEPFRRLAGIGRMPPSLAGRCASPRPPNGEYMEPTTMAAYLGLGMVIEHLAHLCLLDSRRRCEAPVELTNVEIDTVTQGPEIVALDMSEYADPLDLRVIRTPFSVYLKPQQKRSFIGDHVVGEDDLMLCIPADEMEDGKLIASMRSADEAVSLAGRTSGAIPESSAGMDRLISDYEGSELFRFHQWFYSQEQEPHTRWHETYDRVRFDSLPPTAAHLLAYPNDNLLKPAGIRHLVRVLMALGWHPRQIAGLIRSKYERNHGWGRRWYHTDATLRADVYVRFFAGLVELGRDDMEDFELRALFPHGVNETKTTRRRLEDLKQTLQQPRSNGRAAGGAAGGATGGATGEATGGATSRATSGATPKPTTGVKR